MAINFLGLFPTFIIIVKARRRSKPHLVQANVIILALRSSTTVALKYVASTPEVFAMPKSCAIKMGSNAVTAGATGCIIHHASIHKRSPIAPLITKSSPAIGHKIIIKNKIGPKTTLNILFIFPLLTPYIMHLTYLNEEA